MYDDMQPHDKAAVRKMVRAALARGWTISVWDSEEWAIKCSTSEAAILDAALNTDDDRFRLRDTDGVIGSLWAVYGNSPGETFADYSWPNKEEGGYDSREQKWIDFINEVTA